MKRNLAFLTLFFVTSIAFSQSLLWEISGNKLKTPSYLYGTIHIQDKKVFEYGNVVDITFQRCEAFAMEILMDNIDPKTQQDAILMKDQSLENLLSTDDYHLLDSVFKAKTGTSVMLYSKIKPFFLSAQIMQANLNNEMPDPLDMFFYKKAKAANMVTFGVEELETQIAAIDQISLDDQCKMLISSIKDTSTEASNFDNLLSAYTTANLSAMLELSADTTLPANFNKAFLIDRNVGMTKNIVKLIKKHKTFIAIGAAHLGGRDGVINLLHKQGYTVKPIPFTFH